MSCEEREEGKGGGKDFFRPPMISQLNEKDYLTNVKVLIREKKCFRKIWIFG